MLVKKSRLDQAMRELEGKKDLLDISQKLNKKLEEMVKDREKRLKEAAEEQDRLRRKLDEALEREKLARQALEEYRTQHPPDPGEEDQQARRRKAWDELLSYTGRPQKEETR